jgi:hypothetical protein
MADLGGDVVALHRAGRRGPVAADSIHRFALSHSLGTPAQGAVATDWDQYVAELRGRLHDVQAMLSYAERLLGYGRVANPAPETAARGQDDAVGGALIVPATLSPGGQMLASRPEAAVRLVREQWSAAVRKLDDLVDARPAPVVPVLEALGREQGLVRLGSRTIKLSPRHTEILVLLAGQPRGMTTEQIAVAVYGDPGRPATVRTALCRLRKALAPWLHSERHHVSLEIEADFLIVQRLLRAGRAREAARRYPAALMPHSEAPGVADARDELDRWVRSAVMTSDDQEALWAWVGSDPGCDDVPAWKRFLADVDFADPRRAVAMSRLAGLRNAQTPAA